MNPFDFVKSINETKENLIVDELTEREYNPFVVNRSLSYFIDTVFQANEMNRLHILDKKTQYLFLLNSVRQRKRFSGKWHKQAKNEDIEFIMDIFGYSREKALSALPLLSDVDMKKLKAMFDPGGTNIKK